MESAFRRLKERIGCLKKRLDVRLARVPTIVTSCCVLHKLCESQGDALLDEWKDEPDETAELREPDFLVPVEEREEEEEDARLVQ